VPQIVPFKKIVKLGHLVVLQAEMHVKLWKGFLFVNFVEEKMQLGYQMETS